MLACSDLKFCLAESQLLHSVDKHLTSVFENYLLDRNHFVGAIFTHTALPIKLGGLSPIQGLPSLYFMFNLKKNSLDVKKSSSIVIRFLLFQDV